MDPLYRRISLLTVVAVVVAVIAAVTAVPSVASQLVMASAPAAERAIAAAYDRARSEPSLHVFADVEQTLVPRSVPGAMGSSPVQESLTIEGDLIRPPRWAGHDVPSARLHLGSGASTVGVDLLVVDGEAYVGVQGRWKAVDDPLGLSAPGGDYLGFLTAVENPVELDPARTAAGEMRRFGFEINGPRYAEFTRQRTESLLRDTLPQGVQVQPNPLYEQMTGSGEIWVDADGRPRREIIDLSIPEITDQHHAKTHFEVDFTRYGDPVQAILAPVPDETSGALVLPPAGAESATEPSWWPRSWHALPKRPELPLLPFEALAVLMIGVVVIRFRHARKVYIAIVVAVTVSMLTAPLLQAHRLSRFRAQATDTRPLDAALTDLGVVSEATEPGEIAELADRLDRLDRPTAEQGGVKTESPVRDCRTLYVDRGIRQTDDEDNDGLTNAEEWCLGTDYTEADTDADGITDTLEIAGFEYNATHWTLNPLDDDSNQDGMADGFEWFPNAQPGPGQSCPGGHHPIDYDCDLIPNVWDDDNDGDGVPDRSDLSPFGYYPARPSVDIEVTSQHTTYVDVQLQPMKTITEVREAHLRSHTNWLNWPADSQGQIQDLDGSTEDIQLIPVLEFKSPITPTLASQYGILAYYDGTDTVLWAPLQPVGDGGAISAFYARLAFTAAEAPANIKLTDGRIRWTTLANLDSNKQVDGENTVIVSPTVVATYIEDQIRVTGLSVNATWDVGVAEFGTSAPAISSDPAVADEAKTMFNLMSGLAPTFLAHRDPSLPDIVDRFADTTATAPFTDTWGIDPATAFAGYDLYGHRDEALATTTMTRTKAFLDANYLSGSSCSAATTGSITPTLVTALQETGTALNAVEQPTVVVSNDDFSVQSSAPIKFSFPLGQADEQVMRRVQMTQYHCTTSPFDQQYAWQSVAFDTAIAEIHRRYPDATEEGWMNLVDLLYVSFYAGRSRIISVNGHLLPYIGETADANDLQDFILPSEATLPGYVRQAYHLDAFLIDVATSGASHAFHNWADSFRFLHYAPIVMTFLKTTIVLVVKTYLFLRSTWTKSRTALVMYDPEVMTAQSAQNRRLFRRIRDGSIAKEYAQEILGDNEKLSTKAWTGKLGAVAVAAVALVVVLIFTWATYFSQFHQLSGIEGNEFLAQTIASTILSIIEFIIEAVLAIIASSVVGFLIELALLIAMYALVVLVTCTTSSCDWNPLNAYNHVADWVAHQILHTGLLAELPDENGVAVGSPTITVTIRPDAQGTVAGNSYEIQTPLSTTIQPGPGVDDNEGTYIGNRSGNADDVEHSWGSARMTWLEDFPPYASKYSVSNDFIGTSSKYDASDQCDDKASKTDSTKRCYNNTTISFEITEPGRDLALPFANEVAVNLRYMECWGLGIYGCGTDYNYYRGPVVPRTGDPQAVRNAYENSKQALYMDVLPDTTDALWDWGAPDLTGTVSTDWNTDQDADAIDDATETSSGSRTDPTLWDTDGDGLSDGEEYNNHEVLQTDPTLPDTDYDGLDDALEIRLGTDPSLTDTDNDGLSDAEEACHPGDDGALHGGWVLRLSGIGPQGVAGKHVCSDPLKADIDQDGLRDDQERDAGTSPYAPNKAPALSLDVTPDVVHNGTPVTVLEPGDALTVTLGIDNTTAEPVVRPMTMTYPASDIGDMSAGEQTSWPADYTPPTPVTITDGFVWDFGSAPLLPVEATTTTLTGSVNQDVTQSLISSVHATVPYTEVISSTLAVQKILTSTHTVLIDVDDPQTTIGAPHDGQAINGTEYVIGGTASDPTSWPVQVEVNTDGTTWHEANGTDAWAWTWTLPADGVYTVSARATDYVGRTEAPGAAVEAIVDNTAPAAAFTNVADGDVLKHIIANRLLIRGTATDLLSGAPKVAGLATVQLSIDGRPWHNVPGAVFTADPHPQQADWLYVWNVNAARYGDHTLAVRAVDALGQIGDPQAITVTVDTLPPGDILSNARPDVAAGQPVTFLGHVDDEANVPPPARPLPLDTGPVQASEVISGATSWLMPNGPATGTLSAVWIGDVDGDRRADLAVGAPNETVGGARNAGRVSIVYGRAGGWPVPPDAIAIGDSPSSYAGTADAQLGQHIAPAGDVNADGLSDLLFGDPLNGQVYLVFGKPQDLGADLDPQALRSLSSRTRGKIFQTGSGQIGERLSSAGDVNGDGFDDLLIGVTGLPGDKSAFYLVLGSATLLGPLAYSQVFTLDNQAGLPKPVVGAVYELAGSGARATGVGDVNGDQLDDFAIVEPGQAVYLILGGSQFSPQRAPQPVDPADAAGATITQGPPDGHHIAPLGDVNGDGLPDLAYSAGNTPRVVFGRDSGWSTGMAADVSFSVYRPVPSAFISGVGDVNDDGLGDLLMGTLSGRAYLVHGRADLDANQPQAAVLSNVAAVAGVPYAAGADCNCDRSSDLMLVPMQWQSTLPLAAQADGAREQLSTAQRPLRPELSLGPPPAPRALGDLPTTGRASAVTHPLRGFALSQDADPPILFVDNDYCPACSNNGHTWGSDAFDTIQSALDAANAGDAVSVGPGVYRENVVFHAGKDDVSLSGVDPDAVFLDAGSGLGIQVFPPADHGPDTPGIVGVTIENLTIRNAATAIEVNYGGTPGVEDIADPGNIRIRRVVFYQDRAASTAIAIGNTINRSSSNVDIRHNTLIANSSAVKLVHNIPAALDSHLFLRDNLFVALPNASPAPDWFVDDNGNLSALSINNRNGFAGQTGQNGDWSTAPTGNNVTLMTLTDADFQDVAKLVFRLGPTSAAGGLASDSGDLGYFTYHPPVFVDPTYCAKCDNDGHAWGDDAFTSLQAAIGSGARKVNIEPGLYRERLFLVSGVQLFGSGAALTVIAPPDDNAAALIGAEGIRGAQVALLTLAGDDHDDGLRLDSGADVTLSRAVVRNTVTAVSVDGADGGATARLQNNTLVSNASGVAARSCGNVDVSNTVLAYHTGTALSFEPCATTKLHTYDLYWRNGRDLDDGVVDTPTPGEVFADPRFVDPSHNDYRPLPDSPAVDAGDPRSPHPPGTGVHVDIGYVQSADAAVYVSGDYCQTCLNDGLEWHVDAFDTIQQGIDHVPDADGVWTVGVAPGEYVENVALRSGVRLVGSGADLTVIDGSTAGSVVTLDGLTHAEIRGFTVQDGGFDPADAGIAVTGASNTVTVTHNVLFSNGSSGAVFSGSSTGAFAFNTVVDNFGTGLLLDDLGTWVHARFNIFADNSVGVDDGGDGQVFNSYNLFSENGSDAEGGVTLDPSSIFGDPNFVDPSGFFALQLPSPAADAIPAIDYQPVPLGGGDRADLGYQELLATPLSLMLGKPGSMTCGMGASGVASVQAALVKVGDASMSADETAPPSPDVAPASWTTVTISDTRQIPGTNKHMPASYWTWQTALAEGDGLYRLYTVPTDAAGNVSDLPADWYRSSFVADGTAPSVTLLEPSGTTTTSPVVHLATAVTDTVTTGAGVRDNLARVHFNIDGDVYTATRQAGTPGRFVSVAALAAGDHDITAVAVDRAGNVAASPATQLEVEITQNEAALVSPAPGTSVTRAVASLVGYAHFVSTEGSGQVTVSVDDGQPVEAVLDQPKATLSRWTAQVDLGNDGPHNLTLTASRSTQPAGAHATSAALVLDTLPPLVTLQPFAGTAIFDVMFAGTATDATSGVATVEVSTDGGFSYAPASYDSGDWSLGWSVPPRTDFAHFPLRIRAADSAGNMVVHIDTLVADNLGPTPFQMTTLEPAEHTHLTVPSQVHLAWTQPTDGSGIVTMVAASDQISDTVPAGAALPGNSFTADFTGAGAWYVHVLAEDAAGNQTLRHYGPWYVESTGGTFAALDDDVPAQGAWQSSILTDGHLKLSGGEWHAATERLDVDPRSRAPQELWASFDDTFLYLGWRGARWGLHGTGYVYLDAAPGGSATPLPGTSAHALPFDADALVEIGTDGATVYRQVSGAWQASTGAAVLSQYTARGETELRVPWDTLGRQGTALAMLAHSVSGGGPASVFPTDNPMGGPWTSAYRWDQITPLTAPSAGQPQGHHARLSLRSSVSKHWPLGPGGTVSFLLDVENIDHVALPDVTLILTASTGLTFEALDGGTAPAPDRVWPLNLGDLPPGHLRTLEVTARLDSDLAHAAVVSTTAQLVAGPPAAEPALATASVSHHVDAAGPQVRVLTTGSTLALRSGPQTIRGTASDAGGVGVDYVEVNVDGGPWQRAQGTLGWSTQIDVPDSGTFELAARGADAHGNLGAPHTVVVKVDQSPPQVTLDPLPDVVTTRRVAVSGTAHDPQSDGAAVSHVEIQLDDGRWLVANGAMTHLGDGQAIWRSTLALSLEEGVPHRLRARAVDQAGHVGPATEAQTFTVDNRAPRSSLEVPQAGAILVGQQTILVWGNAADGWGVDAVEVSVNGGRTWSQALLGADAARLLGMDAPDPGPAERPGPNALFLPMLHNRQAVVPDTLWAIEIAAPWGKLALRSRAIDSAGNVEPLKPPVRVRNVEAMPFGAFLPSVVRENRPGPASYGEPGTATVARPDSHIMPRR